MGLNKSTNPLPLAQSAAGHSCKECGTYEFHLGREGIDNASGRAVIINEFCNMLFRSDQQLRTVHPQFMHRDDAIFSFISPQGLMQSVVCIKWRAGLLGLITKWPCTPIRWPEWPARKPLMVWLPSLVVNHNCYDNQMEKANACDKPVELSQGTSPSQQHQMRPWERNPSAQPRIRHWR
jgi:hypothetical protein